MSRNETFDLPVLTEGPFFRSPRTAASAIQKLKSPAFLRPIYVICRTLSTARALEVATAEHRVLEDDFGVPVVRYRYGFIPVELAQDHTPDAKDILRDQLFFHGKFLPDGMFLGASVDVVKIDPSVDPEEAFRSIEPRITQYQLKCMESSRTGYGLQDINDIDDYVTASNGMTLVDIEPKLSESLETMTAYYRNVQNTNNR